MKKFTIDKIKLKRRMSPFQIIVLGFVCLVLTGTLLLMLPFASVEPGSASFIDAFFTATSAVCVTGLIVKDTATYWTFFGQLVIITLIQIGGLGVVTVVVGFTMRIGKKIGLMQRNTMQAAISAPQIGGIMKMTKFIIKTTFIIEAIGAFLLAPTFIIDFGWLKGIWKAIFTSISAFCNAGFDLMGERIPFSSLTTYQSNLPINIIIMALIIVGGIGFVTWHDFKEHKFNIKRYKLQTKVVLSTTFFLILIPAIYFFFYEFSLPQWQGMSLKSRILASLFQSVTPRTAGFNTIDYAMFSDSSQFVTIILMLIGGSPGSTAGGMKVTTFTVLVFTAFSVFRRKKDTNLHGRRVADDTVKEAVTIFFMYLTLLVISGVVISCVEAIPLATSFFEVSSAIGTVGLSFGITSSLSTFSKLILTGLMFFGRVGGLTIIFAATSNIIGGARMPEEKITVG